MHRLLQLLESPMLRGLVFRVTESAKARLKWESWNGSLSVKTCRHLIVHPSTPLAKRTVMPAGTLPDWPPSLLLFLPCHRYKAKWARKCLYHWSCSPWKKESAQGCSKALESLCQDLVWSQRGKGSYRVSLHDVEWEGNLTHLITSSYHRNWKYFIVRWCSPTGGPSSILEFSYQAPGSCSEDWWK